MRTRHRRHDIGRTITGWLFVSPLVAGIVLFFAYPIVRVFLISFEYNNGSQGRWVGLQNYGQIFQDPTFQSSLVTTFKLAVMAVVIGLPLGLLVGLMLGAVRRGRTAFRALIFVPYVVSVVAMSLAFTVIFYPSEGGPVNQILGAFGLPALGWFSNISTSQISIILMGLWHGTGFVSLIYLTSLQNIGTETLEAARVDGASLWQEWRYITIPLLKPTTFFLVIVLTINSIKRFGDVYTIGGLEGSPGGTLDTVMLYLYRTGFTNFQFGIASATSVVLFVIIMTITLINFWFFGDRQPRFRRQKVAA